MNLNTLFSNAIKRASNSINYQSVRFLRPRKPFWLGLAKSKMFVIPQPKLILTPEEEQITTLLRENYDKEFKSMLNFICNENPRLKEEISTLDEEGTIIQSPALKEKISLSFKANEEWNTESKRLGDEYMEKVMAEKAEEAQKLIEKSEKMKAEEQETIDEIIKKEKLLSENFVTPENIDEVIENCLKNIEEFDFAIDLQGNRYHGRETLENIRSQTTAVGDAILAEGSEERSEIATERS